MSHQRFVLRDSDCRLNTIVDLPPFASGASLLLQTSNLEFEGYRETATKMTRMMTLQQHQLLHGWILHRLLHRCHVETPGSCYDLKLIEPKYHSSDNSCYKQKRAQASLIGGGARLGHYLPGVWGSPLSLWWIIPIEEGCRSENGVVLEWDSDWKITKMKLWTLKIPAGHLPPAVSPLIPLYSLSIAERSSARSFEDTWFIYSVTDICIFISEWNH